MGRLMMVACKQCGKVFEVRDRRRKFCSLECCWQWRRENKAPGQFHKKSKPWNKGTKGLMKPNSGRFKPGDVPVNKCELGATKVRPDKQGKPRTWVKVAENGTPYDWKLRPVVVWEEDNGPLPSSLLIHHRDRDALNDDLTNLEALTRAQHLLEHRPEYERKRSHAASKATKLRHARNRAARKQNS